MTPRGPRPEALQQRLREMSEVLAYLSTLGDIDADELTANFERRLAVERALTQLVDLAVKTNFALVSAIRGLPPQDYHQSFLMAGEVGLLPFELASRLAPSAGLRNRLVHEYDTIDYTLVADAIHSATRDYGQYVRAVAGYLQRGELGDERGGAAGASHA